MAQPRQQQQQRRPSGSGGLLLAAVMVLLSLCCRDAAAEEAAAVSAASPGWKDDGVAATAIEEVAFARQEAARGFVTAATSVEEGPAVRGRVEMEEVIEDYATTGANGRHNPIPNHP